LVLESQEGSKEKIEKEIDLFLSKKGHSRDKPEVIEHYGETFNAVDRLNKVRSYISFRPRISDEKFRILVALVEIALIQAWLLVVSWRGEANGEEDKLHEAAKTLAQTLYGRDQE